MKRIVAVLVVLAAGPVLAETPEQKEMRCTTTAGIVDDAVVARAEGVSIDDTKVLLSTGEKAVEGKFAPAVEPLVDWVYTLGEDQLSDAVAEAFEQSCLDFDG